MTWKVYKVCEKTESSYRSVHATFDYWNKHDSGFVVTYKIGETAEAPDGTMGLLCFKALDDAKRLAVGFRHRDVTLAILECHTKKRPRWADRVLRADWLDEAGMYPNWDWDRSVAPPEGTCIVDALVPVVVVKTYSFASGWCK
jgi:hypothetical protein